MKNLAPIPAYATPRSSALQRRLGHILLLLAGSFLLLSSLVPAQATAAPDARPFGMSRHEYELRVHEERARRYRAEQHRREMDFERDLAMLRQQSQSAASSAQARQLVRARLAQLELESELLRERQQLLDREFDAIRSTPPSKLSVRSALPVCSSEQTLRIFDSMTNGLKIASAGDYRSAKTPKLCAIYIKPIGTAPSAKGLFSVKAVSVKVWTLTKRLAYDVMTLEFDGERRSFRTISHERFDACGTKLKTSQPTRRWIRIAKGMLSADILRCISDGFVEHHSRSWYDGFFRSVLSGKKSS